MGLAVGAGAGPAGTSSARRWRWRTSASEIDVHGGGLDLIFPHHENERAQSEGATGQRFAGTWLHNGMLRFGDEKMSKSLGNVERLRDALDEWGAETLLLLFARAHYRARWTTTTTRSRRPRAAGEGLREALRRLRAATGDGSAGRATLIDEADRRAAAFDAALDDDLGDAAGAGRAVRARLVGERAAIAAQAVSGRAGARRRRHARVAARRARAGGPRGDRRRGAGRDRRRSPRSATRPARRATSPAPTRCATRSPPRGFVVRDSPDGLRARPGAPLAMADVVYGRNPVREALRGRRRVREVLVTERAAAGVDWLAGAPVRIARGRRGRRAGRLRGPPGLRRPRVDPYPYADAEELAARDRPLIVALDEITDPHNLGAIARSAQCAGADGPGPAPPPQRRRSPPAVCRASAGAVEHLADRGRAEPGRLARARHAVRGSGATRPTPMPATARRRRPGRRRDPRDRLRGTRRAPARAAVLRRGRADPDPGPDRVAERRRWRPSVLLFEARRQRGF